jgi:O-antigen/teichoic acid export membrane protein
LLATIAVQIAVLVVTGWFLGCRRGQFFPRWDGSVAAPTTKYGVKTLFGNLLQFFNYRLDVFLVNFFLGPVAVGIYSVSVLLAEVLWQLPNAASLVLSSKSVNSSHKAMNEVTPTVFWIVLATSSAGALGLAVLGQGLIRLVFSNTFASAYLPLLILLPGVVLLGGGKILSSDIAGRGYPQYNSITAAVALVATVILDVYLIPTMGIAGAALASTISYAICLALSVGFYLKVSGIQLVIAN